MSDYSDLEYAMANDQEAVYELTGLVAKQEEAISSLREQVKLLREALEDSCETIQSHLNTMPIYTQAGWGIERLDPDGEYCGFEPVTHDYVIHGLHELAIETTLSIRDALEQTKSKDEQEAKL